MVFEFCSDFVLWNLHAFCVAGWELVVLGAFAKFPFIIIDSSQPTLDSAKSLVCICECHKFRVLRSER